MILQRLFSALRNLGYKNRFQIKAGNTLSLPPPANGC